MKVSFDFQDVTLTEFGVGRDGEKSDSFVLVPMDPDVQIVLQEMVISTRDEMNNIESDPAVYEPSEKHGSAEYVYLSLEDEMAKQMKFIHEAKNLPVDSGVLSEPAEVFCYFARMTDGKGLRLTGVRRASQFKGILKNRLIRIVSDALKLVEDKVFKLDNDFHLDHRGNGGHPLI